MSSPLLVSRHDQAQAAAAAYSSRFFNGTHFRVDTDGPLSHACFIEQLFGIFLARRLGLGDAVSESMAQTALQTIYQRNFLEAGAGQGAVSVTGITAEARAQLPHKDDESFQTSEIQPGFNFSLAAQLECWDMMDQAAILRRALHTQLYERRNLPFQTPAAFDREALTCRVVLNMRPTAAWWAMRQQVEFERSFTARP